MVYVPFISDYKAFYIQFATGAAQDLLETYGAVVRVHEYPSSSKVKEPYKNQWKDEHGDDEYIPSEGLKVEAFTFKTECAMFAEALSDDVAIAELKSRVEALKQNLRSGAFKTYDAWTGYGFQNVRLEDFPNVESANYGRWGQNKMRVFFTFTLKVNDPVTHMVLSGTNIVNETSV